MGLGFGAFGLGGVRFVAEGIYVKLCSKASLCRNAWVWALVCSIPR